jgi:N-acetylmuramoyl-L-alanine amidase
VSGPDAGALPLRPGDRGEPVLDLQHRLAQLGHDIRSAEHGRYAGQTTAAVEGFQRIRGLDVDGVCGRHTWQALVEAGYRLGDRLVYLRSPMLRGDDVADLQHRLGALGFDAGRVDGIFGPDTEHALKDFQRNMDLTTDGVCGRDTIAALGRLRAPDDATASVRMARERESLRGASRRLDERRIVIGEAGGLGALVGAIGRALQEQGATVAMLHHPDHSERAAEANRFAGDLYLGITLEPAPGCGAAYFSVPGFASVGGQRFAELVGEEVPAVLDLDAAAIEGTRSAILRETRMPAVACRIGPPAQVVERTMELAAAFARAVDRWVRAPVEP